jgi:hypothetical protein
LQKLGQGGIFIRAHGQDGAPTTDFVTFTKYVYVYYDGDMTIRDRAQLEQKALSLNLKVIFRGLEYLATRR